MRGNELVGDTVIEKAL